jgi:predicted transcriptional regulator
LTNRVVNDILSLMGRRSGGLGDQETELLRFVAEQAGPVTVRDAAQAWGEPRGLARTTVLTMMERLRAKNQLGRTKTSDGNWAYALLVPKDALLHNLVHSFVERTLGGSVSPFVAYLTEGDATLSETERTKLRTLLETLE